MIENNSFRRLCYSVAFSLGMSTGQIGLAASLSIPVPTDAAFGAYPGKHGEIASVPIRITKSDLGVKTGSVLIVHGCNGPDGPSYGDWARFLARNGFNAIEINLFVERGLSNVCADGLEGSLTSRSSPREIEAVARWAKSQPWSNGKVGVVGFSMGGTSVLSTASLGLSEPLRASALDAGVAFYPNCRNYASRGLLIPLQIHIGIKDDWTPYEPCEGLGNFWSKSSPNAQLFAYPDAHHGFDQQGLNATFRCPRGQCTGRYDSEADKSARAKTLEFLKLLLQ